jgi:hypothetical protein
MEVQVKSWLVAPLFAVISLSSIAETAVVAVKGKMLYAAAGGRLGSVYRVTDDGAAQLILDGSMRTVPAKTLSIVDGKLTTSLSKSELISAR